MAHEVKDVLVIEPFYGGSHKGLIDLIMTRCNSVAELYFLPATKWPWRARCSALYFAQIIPRKPYKILFASSVLNLAELIALRPDLSTCKKILYFHENQLVYPIQIWKERDFQFGYNQILSCLVADSIIFNSGYNKSSFLASINNFLKLMPDHRPKGLPEILGPKSSVLYYPIDFIQLVQKIDISLSKSVPANSTAECEREPKALHIVWPHRWEHDKDPDSFFQILFELQEEQLPFTLSVLGQGYSTVPTIFKDAKLKLDKKIVNWGYCNDKNDYSNVLKQADVVVSTAQHEFFGVAMLEAAYLGCYPLCPDRLAYPEIFPKECLYNTLQQLKKRLKKFCRNPETARKYRPNIQFELFDWNSLKETYVDLLTN